MSFITPAAIAIEVRDLITFFIVNSSVLLDTVQKSLAEIYETNVAGTRTDGELSKGRGRDALWHIVVSTPPSFPILFFSLMLSFF